ncbi:hypothetical protein [Pseudoxanthomonas sp. USHLN014]|uniref:hypothetical protein n=1 Tax=Pseudoxanthomonas sp. USHLN014 TaxID=3081297 RepID=UPI00301C0D16
MLVTKAQLQTLEDFHDITLASTLPFDWEDFRRPPGTPATYRFQKAPSIEPHRSGIRWYATMSLDLIATSPGHYLLANEAGSHLIDGAGAGLTT